MGWKHGRTIQQAGRCLGCEWFSGVGVLQDSWSHRPHYWGRDMTVRVCRLQTRQASQVTSTNVVVVISRRHMLIQPNNSDEMKARVLS